MIVLFCPDGFFLLQRGILELVEKLEVVGTNIAHLWAKSRPIRWTTPPQAAGLLAH